MKLHRRRAVLSDGSPWVGLGARCRLQKAFSIWKKTGKIKDFSG
jgi:hypothetical protein